MPTVVPLPQTDRPPIVVVTLFSALFPLALPILPIGQLIGVPRLPSSSSSSSSSGDDTDARLCDVFVIWVPGDDAPDPADTSGWRSRVEFALDNARDLAELISWLTEACNGITRDMSVEILSLEDLAACTESTRPADLATRLDALGGGLLGEHCALLCEVEHLALAGVATATA